MSELTDKVIAAKSALMVALGDNGPKYLENMKMWFRHKWSKEEFDIESRKCLTADDMHLHNKFFIAILNKLDAFQIRPQTTPIFSTNAGNNGGRNRKRKRSSRGYNDCITFETYDFLDFIAEDNLEYIRPPASIDSTSLILPVQRYCVQELFLPDAGFILGRFLIGAWEKGLISVDDNVAEYVAVASQCFLKNLLSAIIIKRKNYKVSGDGSFYYDVGALLKDPSVRNTVTRQKIDDAPMELDKEITSPNFMRRSNDDAIFLSACEEVYPQRNTHITLRDVQQAFKNRNMVPSHTVYSFNMERVTQMMH